MEYTYCYKYCEKGKVEANKILVNSESVGDAIIDFNYFVKECLNTCPYKDEVLADINNEK